MTSENRPYQPHPAPVAMSQVERQDGLTIGSLCSGYGGLEMGLQAVVGGRVAWHVEYDKHPSAVLAARFPGVPNYGDVTTTDWSQVEPVDWLTAGYPCQPFSHAGKRKGSADERHLWPFVAAAIGALRPRRVLLENVAGHVSLGLDAVLWDLAALGYDATWGVVRASDAGACHGRPRVFVAASDTTECGWRGSEGLERGMGLAERVAPAAADSDRVGSTHATVSGEVGGAPSRTWQHARAEGGHPATADTDGAPGRWDIAGRIAPGTAEGTMPATYRGVGRDSSSHTAADIVEWGAYAPAVARWGALVGRPAPAPTEPGRNGRPRLNPRFVEWMQGLADGWVTDILPRNPALKALGNGVVPQQAALAVRTLLSLEREVAA